MPGEGLTHGPPAAKKAGGSHHRFSQINRHSLRDGFTGLYVISPGTGLSCPRHCTISLAQLDLSIGRPGPHDFAVRIGSLVFIEAICVHRVPHSTFVTIAIRPSWSRRDQVMETWISEKQK